METYTKTEKQDLLIQCSWNDAVGVPKWTFQAKPNSTEKVLTENIDANGLTIKNIKRENVGNYTCSASNKFGSGVVSTEVVSVISEYNIIER